MTYRATYTVVKLLVGDAVVHVAILISCAGGSAEDTLLMPSNFVAEAGARRKCHFVKIPEGVIHESGASKLVHVCRPKRDQTKECSIVLRACSGS